MNHADEFVKSTIAALGEMDLGTLQPFGFLEYEGLISVPWIKKVQELMKTSKEKGITHEELAHLFPTMGSLRCHILFSLLNMKCARLPKQDRKEIFDFLFKMVEVKVKDDVYGFKSNLLKNKNEVQELFKILPFQKGTPEIARTLGKIYNACYNLSAGLFLDFYLDYCHENEGPYDVSDIYGPGHILVIKRFTEMQPSIWPEAKAPLNELLMYCVYKDVKFSCDMISCHSVYEGDTQQGLVAYAVTGDGNPMHDEKSLHAFLHNITELSVQQWKRLNAMTQEEQKVKGIIIKSYGWRKLFEKAGLPWEPSEEMKQVAKGPLTDQTFWNIPKENQKEFFYNIYHPEIDFYPGDTLDK